MADLTVDTLPEISMEDLDRELELFWATRMHRWTTLDDSAAAKKPNFAATAAAFYRRKLRDNLATDGDASAIIQELGAHLESAISFGHYFVCPKCGHPVLGNYQCNNCEGLFKEDPPLTNGYKVWA